MGNVLFASKSSIRDFQTPLGFPLAIKAEIRNSEQSDAEFNKVVL